MRPKDDSSVEPQHEVLADCLHRLERPAVDALGDTLRTRARMRRLHLEPLANERL